MNQQLREYLKIDNNGPLMRNELAEQASYFRWVRLSINRLPDLCLTFHTTNEGKRGYAYGKAMVDAGLVRGVLDVINTSRAHPFVIEFKVGDNLPTPEQSWFMRKHSVDGTPVALAYNAQEAQDFTEAEFAGVAHSTLAFKRAQLWLLHADLNPQLERSPYEPKEYKPNNRKRSAW